jgi:uncharacterized membrane protein YkoI
MLSIPTRTHIGSLALGLCVLAGTIASTCAQDVDATSSVATDDSADASVNPDTRTTGTPNGAGNEPKRTDQNQARENERTGKFLPYGVLRRKAKAAVSGDVVRVRLLRRTQGPWFYEFTLLGENGKYILVSLDAATGTVISKRKR